MKVMVVPHERFEGIYVVKGKDDAIATKNLNPGESVYNEKRVSIEVSRQPRRNWTPSPVSQESTSR